MRDDGEANSDASDEIGNGVVEVVLREPFDDGKVLDQELLEVWSRSLRKMNF